MLEEAGVRSRKELIDVVVGSCVTSNAGPYGERNCTRDGGGPFGFGNQVLISSHRKLLSSKAMVVNVAETSGYDLGRYGRERRAQANRCGSVEMRLDDVKTEGCPSLGISSGDVLILPER